MQSEKKKTKNGPEIVILKHGSIFIASDVNMVSKSLHCLCKTDFGVGLMPKVSIPTSFDWWYK